MSIALADLLTVLTPAGARAKIVSMLEGVGVSASKWLSGGVASSIITVCAQQNSDFSAFIVDMASGGFLPYATGGWLTLLARCMYGVDRVSATFASGQLTLTNSGASTFPYAARAATFENPTTHKQYVNSGAISLGAHGQITFDIEATEVGTGSNSAPATVTGLVTTMLGVTATNALSIIGLDDQSDDALRIECLAKLAAMSVRGPRGAYTYAIQKATRIDGSPVNINRSTVSPNSHTGQVLVYCASPSGAATSDDLIAVRASIEALVRPDTATVSVLSASTVAYAPTITVWAKSSPGITAAQISGPASDALAAYLASYPIGGLATDTMRGLFASGLDGVIKATNSAIYAVTGATDLALSDGQVATDGVTMLARLT